MRIYKARIKKTQYNIYAVYSNIDGANVYFDDEFYGIIIDGLCYIRIDKTLDTLNHKVYLQGGKVPDTVVKYTFTGATYSVSANADNSFDLQPAASYKDTTVYNYNSDTYHFNHYISVVNINAKPVTTRDQLSWTPKTYNIPENFTKSAKTFKQTLTQVESNKTCIITINQAAGVEYSYTVNSDIEGATVLANGENVGTIENGKCVFTKWNTHAAESYPIKFEGGTLVPKSDEYKLSNSTVPAVSQLGATLDLDQYITSTVRTYTPYSPTGSVTKNGSVTLNTKYNYKDSDTAYTISGDLVFDENQTTNKVTRTFTVTQTKSGKKITITVTQNAGVKYTYTIKSNIEGATVKFGSETVGTITDGQLIVTKWNNHAASSYAVTLSGGTMVSKATEYTFTCKDLPIQSAEAGTINLSSYVTSTKKVYTPQRPNGNVNRNGSLTLNTTYTSATSNVTYSPTTISVAENQTTSAKNYSTVITQSESNKKVTVEYQQSAGVRYTYTVNSDVEGAKVLFNGISNTGTITDGKYTLIRWNSHAATSYTVSLSGGTMPKKATQYALKNTLSSTTVPATGKSYSKFIEETTITYTSVMPANASCNRNSSVTMNTTYTETEIVNTVGSYTVPENQTTNTKKYTYNYTHSKDSTNKITVTFNQQAGVKYTYTVNSNIAGSKVTYSNGSSGTISGGKHVLTLWNNHAPASLTFTLSGGTVSEPDPWVYEFDVTSLGTTSLGSNDTYSASGQGESKLSTAATSRKRRYEYKVPTTTFTVSRNGSTTANETKAYTSWSYVTYSITAKSQSWITNSGNIVTIAKNPNTTTRSGTITYTQDESGKTDVITINQAKGSYSYTINSNCNGGTVYFNNVNKGTISGGKLTFEDTASSGTVRISGGVPTDSRVQTDTDYDYDTDTDSQTDSESSTNISTSGNVSLDGGGDTGTITVVCNTRTRSRSMTRTRSMTRSRPVYTNTTYTAPANKTVNGGSTTTMNYTSSTSTSYGSYGSWQYGSWSDWSYGSWGSWSYSRRTPTQSYSCSWLTVTRGGTTGSGSTLGYDFTVRAGEGGSSSRSCTVTFKHPDDSSTATATVSQSAAPYTYYFSTGGSLTTHKAGSATSYTNANIASGLTIYSYRKRGSSGSEEYIGITVSSQPNQVNAVNAVNQSGNHSELRVAMKASNYLSATQGATDSYSLTIKQNESGKTLNITVKQYRWYLALDSAGQLTKSINLTYVAGNGGKPTYVACQDGYGSTNWTATSNQSWLTPSPSSGSNGTALYGSATQNSGSSARTATISIKPTAYTGSTRAGITYHQSAKAATYFYLTVNNSTDFYCVSTGALTGTGYVGQRFNGQKITSVYTDNGQDQVAPFNGAETGSKTFNLYRVSGTNVVPVYVTQFSVTPGGRATVNV